MVERSTRRAFMAATATAFAGCSANLGEDTQTATSPNSTSSPASSDNPAVGDAAQMGALALTSPAFKDGESIPEKYGHDAENVNPPLSITGVPEDAESLTLILDDPDATEVSGKVWLHWLVWNVPTSRSAIPEDWTPAEAVEGTNDFGNRGYGGPSPPNGTHTYRFKLYALRTRLDLSKSADKRAVGSAMGGNRLAQTQLTGTYAP